MPGSDLGRCSHNNHDHVRRARRRRGDDTTALHAVYLWITAMSDTPLAGIHERADRYDLLAQLRADKRFTNGHSTPRVRDFIEAVYWATWTRGSLTLHTQGNPSWAYRSALLDDLPRYEPPVIGRASEWEGVPCSYTRAAGPKRGQACKRPSKRTRRVATNPETGEYALAGWCPRHAHHAPPDMEPDPDGPVPAPNKCGLFPCYLAPGEGWSWEDAYRSVSRSWRVPAVGVRADDWPTPGKAHASGPVRGRPVFKLIQGGEEHDGR